MLWCAVLLVLVTYCEGRVTNIINGQDVSRPGKYPWQVSLQDPRHKFHFCGASVISNKWILTAAHCVEGKRPSEVSVVVGLHDRQRTYGMPKDYAVSRFISHPRYSRRTINFDIALIEVQGSIQFNNFVQPIALATHREFGPSAQCVISGWGDTVGGAGRAPNVLQETSITIVDAQTCQQTQGKDNVVCLFNGKSGSCQGDSGGPLACKSGSTWKLAGATSYGQRGCPVTRAYSVYADVGYFNSWVKDSMSGGGSGSGTDGGPGGSGGSSCSDVHKDCGYFSQQGFCRSGQYQQFMKMSCAKTCGFC